VEHAFQAAKYLCSSPKDLAIRQVAMFTNDSKFDAREAKKRGGRKYMSTLGVKLDIKRWGAISRNIMTTLLRSRWHHDSEFREILIETQRQGLHLVHFERSGRKSFWGGCVSKDDNRTVLGQNMLGKMMMEMTRDRIASQVRAVNRIRELVVEMRNKDLAIIRAAGQTKRFLDLCRCVDVCEGME
jgi:predicted NAD-dependent protein-ADP-ribosyltransferase YbiA (DUF1768 family)